MIAKLTGILDDFGPDWAVIDVNGVGYMVFCSARTLQGFRCAGRPRPAHTEMQVSETDMRLIGFTSAGSGRGSAC
jgi:Holliday junction DNA helicase RuvA